MGAVASFSVSHENEQCQDSRTPKTYKYTPGFKDFFFLSRKKNWLLACGHFDYLWEAENLTRSSPY